jgi:hypothetical protein
MTQQFSPFIPTLVKPPWLIALKAYSKNDQNENQRKDTK